MSLPALVYIGDVPVEASYHGSALVYRLLQTYPRGKLRVIEGNVKPSMAERRLSGVPYRILEVGANRPLHTRFHRIFSSWYTRTAARRAANIRNLLDGFNPEAVLTVAHGFSWIAAARFARDRRIPLHLIVHDDWPRQADLIEPAQSWVDREFGRVYRQAASRLCVSENMEESYRRRYGASGTVLLPSRAADASRFEEPPERVALADRRLVVGFGGTINSPGYVRALQQLATALEAVHGTLNLYGPLGDQEAKRAGLARPNVRLVGLVRAEQFISRMRAEVDVLFLPMSFDEVDRENMRLCFPSKLTDYTAAGLPLLVYGPEDSSGIRWARANASAAEIVDREDGRALASALERLTFPAHRHSLAKGALAAGEGCFSHARAEAILRDHLGVRS